MSGSSWLPGDRSSFRTGFLKVAFLIGGTWTDVPMAGTFSLSDDGVEIKRGAPNEGGRTDPGSLRFTVLDPTGILQPRNPSSPYYGQIGRGTKVRVQVEMTAGTVKDRVYASVVSFEPVWTRKGEAATRVEAAGILRQLGQGQSPVRSPLYRYETTQTASVPRAYWPMEDGRQAVAILPARVTGSVRPPLRVSGTVKWAGYSDLVSGGPMPTLQGGTIVATAPPYTDAAGSFSTLRFALRVASSAPAGAVIARVTSQAGTSYDLTYTAGTLAFNGVTITTGAADTPLWMWLAIRQNGTNVEWSLGAAPVGPPYVVPSGSQTVAGSWNGVASVAFNPNGSALGDTAVGHVAILPGSPLLTNPVLDVFYAYIGEQAHTRVARLCSENGLTSSLSGATPTAKMGYQDDADVLTLLRQCEATDGGMLYEPRGANALEYRTALSLYSQAPVSVAYVENLLDMAPVEDDATLRNTVTVTRAGGSSATVTEPSGQLGTVLAGVYDEGVTLSLAADADAAQQAGWRVHLGTTDEARWPRIGVDLADPRIGTGLRDTFLSLDLGSRLDVTGVRARLPWLPPFTVSQLVLGYTEKITAKSYVLTFNCAPARPYRAAFYGSASDRYSGDGTTLAAPGITTTTQTTFTVTPPAGVAWTTVDGSYDVLVNGEQMTVSSVTGGTSFTVVRGVNGILKTHAAGSAVTLADPCYYGL